MKLTHVVDDNVDVAAFGQLVKVEVVAVMYGGNKSVDGAVKINCFDFRSVVVEPERLGVVV